MIPTFNLHCLYRSADTSPSSLLYYSSLPVPSLLISSNPNHISPVASLLILLQSFQIFSQVDAPFAFLVRTECLLSFTVCLDDVSSY